MSAKILYVRNLMFTSPEEKAWGRVGRPSKKITQYIPLFRMIVKG